METRQEKIIHYATAEEIQQIKEKVGHIFDVDDRGNLALKPEFNLPKLKLIFVRGGDATLGSDYWESNPPHDVKFTYNFFIGQYPVNQELYKAVTGKSPSRFQGSKHPVEQVSWKDAMDFCNVLNEKTGYGPVSKHNYDMLNPQGKPAEDITQLSGFRLPTESEWEFTAMGGKAPVAEPAEADARGDSGRPGEGQIKEANTFYPGSNYLDEVGWYDGNNDYETKPVGLKFPNQLGIYDMSGNVWEWCLDWYDKNFYKGDSKKNNPANLGKGSVRVLRGGAWFNFAGSCRMAFRFNFDPDDRSNYVGFRLLFALQFTT